VSITVWASDSDGVANVQVYFRLADKNSRKATDWTPLSMSLTPDGFLGPAWTHTISTGDIPSDPYRESWLQFYFVAIDTRGAQTQSQTYGNLITVIYCEAPK
jgi:hypothetical protein